MTYFDIQKQLEQFISELSARDILNLDNVTAKAFTKLANDNKLIIMLSDVALYRPVFLNNTAISFLGFNDNWIKEDNYFNYLKSIHKDTYNSFFDVYQFYRKDNTEYLHIDYKLLHNTNEWRIVNGVTKVILRKSGLPKYALTLANYNDFKQKTNDALNILTKREKEISYYLANSFTKKQTAEKLELSVGTVETHTKNIYKKLNINKLSKLVTFINQQTIV